MEGDPDFAEKFNKFFSDANILEANEYTPEVLEDTYLNMEMTLPKDDESAQFSKVTKRLHDVNDIFIGIADDDPLLD